jgi:glycosyltransferase involved in cell wall biosynthesis
VRVLLVSQYYAPETGATQNRMQAFVEGLLAKGHEVTVICEQPNHPYGRYQPGYGRRPLHTERRERLTVHRLWVSTSPRKTTTRRLLFYGSFAAGALALTATLPSHDVVFVTSPPLPGALAAALVARLRRTPVVVDVRDLWPAAAQALGELSDGRLLRVSERLERWLYRAAACVTATTRPFCRHIDEVARRPLAVHLPNGALDELVALRERPPPDGQPFRLGYAGNFGIAQGLDIVLDAAARLAGERIEFLLVGGGPLESDLRRQRDERGLVNLELRAGVPASEIGALMLSCHALLIPLRDHALLADFIPSKLYDAMAVGRPVIVAARGESAAFVQQQDCGIVIEPQDGAALADAVRRLAGDRALSARLGARGKAAAPGLARSRQAATLCELLESAASRSDGASPSGGMDMRGGMALRSGPDRCAES